MAEFPADTLITASPGDVSLLPCRGGSGGVASVLTIWTKDGQEIARRNAARQMEGQRITVLIDGSLSINAVVPTDQGNYLCNLTRSDHSSFSARVLLRVVGRPSVRVFVRARVCRTNCNTSP